MKIKAYKLLIVAGLSLLMCDDDAYDREDVIAFNWTAPGDNKIYKVVCDTLCEKCEGYSQDGITRLVPLFPSNSPVYAKCRSEKETDTTGPAERVSMVYVSFLACIGDSNRFGFDEWQSTITEYSPEISYISVKTNDSTSFKINIKFSYKAYYRYFAEICDDINNSLSFNSNTRVTTYTIDSGLNILNLYSLNNITGEYRIEVNGVSLSGDTTLLAGDILSDDELHVIVYNEKLHTNNNLYLVNNPSFRPPADRWVEEFNRVLKQAVVKIDTPIIDSISTYTWDANGNHIVDYPSGVDLLRERDMGNGIIFNELGLLLLECPPFEECEMNSNSSNFIIKGRIRYHYILTADADSGDTIITIENVAGIWENEILKIGPYNSPDSIDTLIVGQILSSNSIKVYDARPPIPGQPRNGLKRNFRNADAITLYNDQLAAGITPPLMATNDECISCSFVSDNYQYQTHIHEFLHQAIAGLLEHVGDYADNRMEKDNIMYYSSSRNDTKLRHRLLGNRDPNSVSQQQWRQMH